MTDAAALARALLAHDPALAAEALSPLPGEDVAAFLVDAPIRDAAATLGAGSPALAAGALAAMAPQDAAEIVAALSRSDAVAALRLCPPPARDAILNAAPPSTREAFALAISFPPETVGARMRLDAPTLTLQDTVAAARDALAAAPSRGPGFLCVVDGQQRFHGVVTPLALLKAAPESRLARIVDQTRGALPARAAVRAVAHHPAWAGEAFAPVVDREGRLLGTLARAAAARAAVAPDPAPGSLLMSVADALAYTAFEAVELLAGPPRRRVP